MSKIPQSYDDFDAQGWAEEFVSLVKKNSYIATDVDIMRAWFASAIMVGYDEATRRHEQAYNAKPAAPPGEPAAYVPPLSVRLNSYECVEDDRRHERMEYYDIPTCS